VFFKGSHMFPDPKIAITNLTPALNTIYKK